MRGPPAVRDWPWLQESAASHRPGLSSPSITPVGCKRLAAPRIKPTRGLCLLDLRKLQLDRRRPAENQNRHAQAVLFVIYFLDHAVEIGERPVRYPDCP